MLHFNGPGEILIWADWTDGDITPDGKAKLLELLKWAASKRYTIQLHWNPDRTVHDLLDVVEEVSKDNPVRDLRWTVLHLYNASEDSLARIKQARVDLGRAGRPVFRRRAAAEGSRRRRRAKSLPRDRHGAADGHHGRRPAPTRTASRPTIRSCRCNGISTAPPSAAPRRAASEEAPTRRQALEMYTRNSAFEANEDDRRGTLEPGKLADLAVLSADYMTVPVKEVGKIRSVLTMVGGKIVFADEPFAGLDAP